MAQELEAWNLQALQASSLELYALSLALRGSSTTGIGGTPFLAGEGNLLRRRPAMEGPTKRATSNAEKHCILKQMCESQSNLSLAN